MLYLVLVGLPFLGVLAILRIGEQLEAPVAVSGTWAVNPATVQAMHRSCAPLELPAANAEMTISQSGRYVQVQFNDAAQSSMIGRLNARTLTVRQVRASGARARNICGETTLAVLQLRLHGGGTARRADQLGGAWRMPECDVCRSQSFGAVRRSAR